MSNHTVVISLVSSYFALVWKNEYGYNKLTLWGTTISSIDSNSVSISNTYVQSSGCLTRQGGVFYGPSGKETYYNLNMSGVVAIMRNMGYSEEEYPYWIREDGCKMLGNYIIVAANLDVYPRGSLVPTSLGTGIVCDTGGFVSNGSGVALDIATAW